MIFYEPFKVNFTLENFLEFLMHQHKKWRKDLGIVLDASPEKLNKFRFLCADGNFSLLPFSSVVAYKEFYIYACKYCQKLCLFELETFLTFYLKKKILVACFYDFRSSKGWLFGKFSHFDPQMIKP